MKHNTQKYLQLALYILSVAVVAFLVILMFWAIAEIRRQGEINQRYIRCIVLLPRAAFTGTDAQRAKAIDNCAVQSKLPPEVMVK